MDRGTWQATGHAWGRRESDTTKRSTLYRKEAVDMGVVWGIFLTDPIILT